MIRVIDGWYESYPDYDDSETFPNARQIPTVYECDAFSAATHQDIIRQLTSGQGLYYGYECERFVDNRIREVSDYGRMQESKKSWKRQYELNKLIKGLTILVGYNWTQRILKQYNVII